MDGRHGQVQGGVNVFLKEAGVGRLGIQCKKYTLKRRWLDFEPAPTPYTLAWKSSALFVLPAQC